MMADGDFPKGQRDPSTWDHPPAPVGKEYRIKGTGLHGIVTYIDVKGCAWITLASGEKRKVLRGELEPVKPHNVWGIGQVVYSKVRNAYGIVSAVEGDQVWFRGGADDGRQDDLAKPGDLTLCKVNRDHELRPFQVGELAYSDINECVGTVTKITEDGIFWTRPEWGPSGGILHFETQLSRPEGSDLFFSAAMLQGKPVPERKQVVDGMVPSGTVTLLGGDGGTGKSLLALQLSAAVATGGPWLGRSVAAGPVVDISAEDDDEELHRRLFDVTRAEGLQFTDLDKMVIRSLAGKDALLATIPAPSAPLKKSKLFDEVSACMVLHKPVLLVLDTLADLFPGNENDRAQARQFIGMLRGLAIEHECAVVLLSHPSLSGMNSGSGTSGSTGWNNSVRSRLYLERVTQDGYEANPDARVLKTMKANYGRIGGEISMTWRDGVFVADAPETGLDRMASGMKAERVFLKLLRLFAEQGRRVNANSGLSYAPSVFDKHPEGEGIKKSAFRSVMDVLLGKGTIAIGQDGPPSKRVSYLYEVAK